MEEPIEKKVALKYPGVVINKIQDQNNIIIITLHPRLEKYENHHFLNLYKKNEEN